MTQELALWVLIAGVIGFVWVLTCAILTQPKQTSPEATEEPERDQPDSTMSLQRRAAA